MARDSLHSSIRRLLLIRIAAAAAVISVAFGLIAYLNGQSRLEATVKNLAVLQVARFNRQVLVLLDRPDGPDPALLQEELEDFAGASGGGTIDDGEFVLARVFDAEGGELAQIADREHPHFAAINRRVDTSEFVALGPSEQRAVTVDIMDNTYVGVAVPMLNSDGSVAAQVVGAFAVSDLAMDRIGDGVLRTVAYVIAIVLATSLVIYPIIGQLLGRMSRLTINLLDANLETMQVLGSAIAKRDSDTDAHNYRVTAYSVALAEAVSLPREQIKSLIKGALLHDVGKLGIRDDVLLKPGKLDDEEFAVMQTHVQHGLDITDRAQWLADARDVVGGHHEKYGGEGYPAGLAGRDIPMNARIFAIADVFDALTSRRPYKEPLTFAATMEILERGRGSHFDPELLDAFAAIAADLYAEFGDQRDDRARARMESLSDKYFRADLADLMG